MTRSLAETEMLITEAIEAVEEQLGTADERWTQVIEAIDNLDANDGVFKPEDVENARRQGFRGVRGEIDGEPLFRSYVALRAALGALQDHNDEAFWQSYSSGEFTIAGDEPGVMADAANEAGQSPARRRSKRKRRRRAEPRRFDNIDGGGVAAVGVQDASTAVTATSGAPGDDDQDHPASGDPMRRSLKDRLDQLDLVPPRVSQIDVVSGASAEIPAQTKREEPVKQVRRAAAPVAVLPRGGHARAVRPSHAGEEASVVIVRRSRPDVGSPSSGGAGS